VQYLRGVAERFQSAAAGPGGDVQALGAWTAAGREYMHSLRDAVDSLEPRCAGAGPSVLPVGATVLSLTGASVPFLRKTVAHCPCYTTPGLCAHALGYPFFHG
jgi:hypothetical protein